MSEVELLHTPGKKKKKTQTLAIQQSTHLFMTHHHFRLMSDWINMNEYFKKNKLSNVSHPYSLVFTI